jgi:hypothetical protein
VQVNKKLEEVLTNKNSIIRALQYDVAKVSKAHNDLIRVYEAKLAEYGIPAGAQLFRCSPSQHEHLAVQVKLKRNGN